MTYQQSFLGNDIMFANLKQAVINTYNTELFNIDPERRQYNYKLVNRIQVELPEGGTDFEEQVKDAYLNVYPITINTTNVFNNKEYRFLYVIRKNKWTKGRYWAGSNCANSKKYERSLGVVLPAEFIYKLSSLKPETQNQTSLVIGFEKLKYDKSNDLLANIDNKLIEKYDFIFFEAMLKDIRKVIDESFLIYEDQFGIEMVGIPKNIFKVINK